jgi:hypothetical protein
VSEGGAHTARGAARRGRTFGQGAGRKGRKQHLELKLYQAPARRDRGIRHWQCASGFLPRPPAFGWRA